MPVYVYRCIECYEGCEKIHGMTEEMNDSCPSCAKTTLVRVPTSIAVKQVTTVGNVVKEFIQINKEENRREKEYLSQQEYKK